MTSTLKSALVLVVATSGFLAADPPSPLPEGKKVGEKIVTSLEGRYAIVSGERDGQPIPEERIKGLVVRFTADTIVGTDKDRKEFLVASYVLDPGQSPWVIRMTSATPKEGRAVGLIKKEGDVVTLVYALPGADAPKEFRTKERQNLFAMKSLDGKDKPKP